MNPSRMFSDSDFQNLKWIYEFSQIWMASKGEATALALDILIKEKNERVMRIPKESLDINIMTGNGIITIATVLTALSEKFRMLLAMKDRIGPNDYKVLQRIYNEITTFASDLKAIAKEGQIEGKDVLEEPEEDEGMSKIKIHKYIDSILDAYSAGKITQDQMKNQIKEFASRPPTDIGRFGGNIIGTLGLNT